MNPEEDLEFAVTLAALFGVDRETAVAWHREAKIRRLRRLLWELYFARMQAELWAKIVASLGVEPQVVGVLNVVRL